MHHSGPGRAPTRAVAASNMCAVVLKRLRLLIVVLAFAVSLSAVAQESGRAWTVYGLSGTFNTQEDAERAIRDLGGPYQHVRFIRTRTVRENKIELGYWMGIRPSVIQPWKYATRGSPSSDEEMIENFLAYYDARSLEDGCPTGAYLESRSGWWTFSAWPDGTPQREWDDLVIRYRADSISGQQCVLIKATPIGDRSRTRCEISAMTYDSDSNTCSSTSGYYEAVVASTPLACDACTLVGNPVDFATGDKFETEPDFDLGWIAFARHYHSASSNDGNGGFGYGWTHNHNLRLAISVGSNSDIGLIRSNGSHQPFRRFDTYYAAADRSGDRIVANGPGWQLSQSDKVLEFDASGRLLEQRFEDGRALTYAYDALGRLESITNTSGRSLVFSYADGSGDASILAVSSSGTTLANYTYTANGQVETVTYPDNITARQYHYEDARFPKNLTGITSEDGQRYSTFAYDEKGRVVSSQHTGGVDSVVLAYTSEGGAIVTDALGHEINHGLTPDTGGRPRQPSSAADGRGVVSRTYYEDDFRRRLNVVTDRKGVQTKHEYAEVTDSVTGQPARVHTTRGAFGLPEERVREMHYDLASNRLLLVREGNRETRYVRNEQLQPVSIVVTDNATSETRETTVDYCTQADVDAGYCPFIGYVKSVDGPRADVVDLTSYVYYLADDPYCATMPTVCRYRKGDLRLTINAQARIVNEVLVYNGAGRPMSVRDANGVITDYEYHPRGWLTAQKMRGTNNASEADDRITRIEYWPTGLVKKITQPDGAFTSYSYDTAQRLIGVKDNAGNTVHYTLDNAGNRIQEDTRDAGGALRHTLSRIYNQLGQLQILADAQANPTEFSYDANGSPESVTDALERVTDHDYDPLNRLQRTLQDVGGIAAETRFEYDVLDSLTKVTDPKGLETTYAYNGFGDLIQLTSPDTGITTHTYDSAGNRRTTTDARGVTATYSYDMLNRLVSIAYPDTSLNVDYTYDTSVVCLQGETFGAGRLTRVIDSSGFTHYCYDRFGQLVRKWQVTNGQAFTLRYEYTKAGQLQRMTYPDGTEVDYVRDDQGRTTEVGVTAPGNSREVLLTDASWYPFGPVGAWTYGNGRSHSRTLDLDYRPQSILSIGAGAGGLDLGFGFDPAGNLTSLHGADRADPPRVRLDYDPLNRLTEFRDGPSDTVIEGYSYDATGNRTGFTNAAGTQTYDYPGNSHHLTAVNGIARSYDAVGNTTAIAAKEYVYNAANRMSAVKQGGAVTMNYVYNGRGEQVRRHLGSSDTTFVYNESGQLLGEYGATGEPARQYVWLDDLPVGVLNGIATIVNRLHYIEPDHLGTPRAVIEPQRDVAVWTWDIASEAFGNSAPNEDPDGDGTAFVLDMRFPGQRYDAISSLNYNYFRDYDTGSGRYVQSDPIGLAGGINTYAYVHGNPVSLTDPFGLDVYLCSQPAQIPGMGWVSHQWVKTDTMEAGMGTARGGRNAGNQSGDKPGDPVQVTDHSGRSEEKGASCKKVEGVDENLVNAQLEEGRSLGKWWPWNQCQTFSMQVLNNARIVVPGPR